MSKADLNLQWLLAERPFDRGVRQSDFRLHEGIIPEPKEGQFVVRVIYSSLAPVMRFYMLDGAGIEKPLEIGDVMRGRGVGEVIRSRNAIFQVGDIVHGKMGWQQYALADGSDYYLMFKVNQREISVSTALGVLGMTGFTAYFGLLDIGKPIAGEVVLVSGAAGGVGSNVGQLAKIIGCHTVGIAGSEEKCQILTGELGYDAAINYRAGDVGEQIETFCPEGIDIFFDNVGGEILNEGLGHINKYARIVSCGQISQYIGNAKPTAIRNVYRIGRLNALLQGFLIYDYATRFHESEADMVHWIKEGSLTYKEDILDGIENMPEALIRLYDGKNHGKQLVKVGPEPF